MGPAMFRPSLRVAVLLAMTCVAGCTPHRSQLLELHRLGAEFPPPGRTTPIYFGRPTPDGAPRPFGDEELRRAIPHLKPLPRLELDVSSTQVTNKSMVLLADLPRLIEVNLAGTEVTAAGVALLRDATSLKSVLLEPSQVSSEELQSLRREMPRTKFMAVERGLLVPLVPEKEDQRPRTRGTQ